MTDSALFSFKDFFNPSFQYLILSRLIQEENFLAQARSILKPKYFASESMSHLCETVFEYFDEYHKLPPADSLLIAYTAKVEGPALREKYAELLEHLRSIAPEETDQDFINDRMLKFCQRAEAAEAVVAANRQLKEFDIAKLEQKISKIVQMPSVFSDLGLDLKRDWQQIFRREEKPIFQTGLGGIDYALRGGARAGELISFLAPMKRGKSLVLANVAMGLMTMGHLVAIYSMEMQQDDYMDRILGNLARRPSNYIKEFGEELAEIMENLGIFTPGNLIIKKFPAGIMLHTIKAHMNMVYAQYGKYPIPIIDYIDKLGHNAKDDWKGKRDNYTEVRNLGEEYGLPVFTADQTNAGGLNAEELDATHQSGSIGKGMEADVMFGMLQTPIDYACSRFILQPFLNRNERKDLLSYWLAHYDQGHIEEISGEVFFALQPASNFLDLREQRQADRNRFNAEQQEKRKTQAAQLLNQLAKVANGK